MDKNKVFKNLIKKFLFKAINLRSQSLRRFVYKININFLESGFNFKNFNKRKKK